MNFGPHAAFIVTAYAAAAAWVLLDYRAQLRKLADLEARGVTRRSDRAAPASP